MSTDVHDAKPTRGRPRTFDRDAVLDALVQLFWERGYEATSMQDIVEATGLNKSSLYNCFGSKDDLFSQALDRYVDSRSTMVTALMLDGQEGLADVVGFFDMMWSEVHEHGEHRGCLAVNTSTELGHRDATAVAVGDRYRSVLRTAFGAALGRASDLGEVDPAKVPGYVSVLVSFVLGIAVIVRSGADDAEIRAHLEGAKATVYSWQINGAVSA